MELTRQTLQNMGEEQFNELMGIVADEYTKRVETKCKYYQSAIEKLLVELEEEDLVVVLDGEYKIYASSISVKDNSNGDYY